MDAKTVANYMLYIMGGAFDDLTNMKINKLLYFAQGYFLKKYGKALFDDKIEAWDHGPVVPTVYNAYKTYGDKPIQCYDADLASRVSPEAEEILFDVARKYGRYTASTLRNKTHASGTPWAQVYQKGQNHIEIPIQVIRDYFADANSLEVDEKQFKDTDFVGYRDTDGILVLPKEWDDGAV